MFIIWACVQHFEKLANHTKKILEASIKRSFVSLLLMLRRTKLSSIADPIKEGLVLRRVNYGISLAKRTNVQWVWVIKASFTDMTTTGCFVTKCL